MLEEPVRDAWDDVASWVRPPRPVTPVELFDDLPTTRPEPVGPPPASPTVQALLAQVREVAAVAPAEVPGPQALVDLALLLRVADELHRAVLTRVGDADVRGLAGIDGDRTIGRWMDRQGVEVPTGTVRTARRLVRHRSLREAVAAQALPVSHADAIAEALGRLRPHLDRPDGLVDGQPGEEAVQAVVVDGVLTLAAEGLGSTTDDDPRLLELHAELSELAFSPLSQVARLEAAAVLLAQVLPSGTPASALRTALDLLVGALLPNLLEQQAADAARDRRLSLKPHGDGRPGGTLRAELDAETYELCHTALNAAAGADSDDIADTAGWRQAAALCDGEPAADVAETACVHGVVRSRVQRAHDALRLLLRAALDTGALGERGKHAPHIAVTIGLDQLNGAAGALPARGSSGQPVPLSLVMQWRQDACVTRFVLGLGHRVLETSHTGRTLKAHERRIKHLEAGGQCQGARCTRGPARSPGDRLVPHHPDAYARTGTTRLDDTAWLCDGDHDHVHRGGTLTLKDGRRLTSDGWLA